MAKMRVPKRPFAIVLPGGGFRGAYQAGAIAELGRIGIQPDIVATASVGTCNGAAMVLQMWDMLPQLWERAVDLQIFYPSLILQGKSPFAISKVLSQFVKEYSCPGQFQKAHADFLVSVTNATTVKNEIVDFKSEFWNFEELTQLYLASSSIPHICDRIEIRGHWYVDGGITNNCPIDYAIQRGAKEVWVISMGKPAFFTQTMFTAMKHSLSIFPHRHFTTLRLLKHMLSEQPCYHNEEVIFREISPSAPLQLGHLRLTRRKIKNAIDLGKKDIQQLVLWNIDS